MAHWRYLIFVCLFLLMCLASLGMLSSPIHQGSRRKRRGENRKKKEEEEEDRD